MIGQDATLPGNADRYAMLIRPVSSLAEIAEACATLGLFWYATTSPGSWHECEIRIFFDAQGMRNYMRGLYDQP